MDYIELKIIFNQTDPELKDRIVAKLAFTGFEGFQEEDPVLTAFIQKDIFKQEMLDELMKDRDFSMVNVETLPRLIKEKNWNEEWERNFHPILIDGICTIKAPFHEVSETGISITIEPKMSFGTGHHQTTRLMIRHIAETTTENRLVLDMGCGTGILGIFALLHGAAYVTAIDIDKWACRNCEENFRMNIYRQGKYNIIQGNAGKIPSKTYDIILANINRNTLIKDIPVYFQHLTNNGALIVSGILKTDKDLIARKLRDADLIFSSEKKEGDWISLKFVRK